MSALWHDFVTSPPGDTAYILARRVPEDTAPATAYWLPDMSGLAVGPSGWPIPWPFITRWTPAPYGSSAQPQPHSGKPLPDTAWRDLLANPPADSQLCWVRRWPEETRPFVATWVAGPDPYFLLDSNAQLPWYLAWKWKPKFQANT